MLRPAALIILDGFGYSQKKAYNAIANAYTPTIDYMRKHYPHTLLNASGCAVGMPEGFAGNSEVGHLTIGAGRIIKQPIAHMHELIKNKALCHHPTIKQYFTPLAATKHTLHLIGLLSDAGTHSHEDHLYAFLDCAQHYGIAHIAIHCILDGRDGPPKAAQHFLQKLEAYIVDKPTMSIASLCGRFYAMDRNNEWVRTQAAYNMLTTPAQPPFDRWQQAIDDYYEQAITDEFIPPTRLCVQDTIQDGDGVIFFNYRPDRARQLTRALVDPQFTAFKRPRLKLACFITPTAYANDLPTQNLLKPTTISNTLTDVLCAHGKKVFAIAETEKYAHVTYFLNGGREAKLPNETQVLVPSISTTTYKDYPCMSAPEITAEVLRSLQTTPLDFYVINYANADMVGHAGCFDATVRAVECLDTQLKQLYDELVIKQQGTMYVTADHGNAEEQWDEQAQQPHTAHTTNPVEFIFVNPNLKDTPIPLPLTGLKDIAPFILKQYNIQIPREMQT